MLGTAGWRQRRGGNIGLAPSRPRGVVGHWLGKNPGDVWQIASANFAGQHFATFPPALVERPLLADCPEQICEQCGLPYERPTRSWRDGQSRRPQRASHDSLPAALTVRRQRGPLQPDYRGRRARPFFGAGTVGVVAEQHGRDWLGIELNPASPTSGRAMRLTRDEAGAQCGSG